MSELETADRQPSTPEIKRTRLKGKIDRLKQEIERVKAIEAQLASAEETQISLTDPDARSMQGTGKATGTVGYNVQCAVETENHLIIAHEVTNAVNDRHSPAWLSRLKRPLAPKPSRPSPIAVITTARKFSLAGKLV